MPSINNIKGYIDPGHGGIDPGACANGLQEKDLTLQISLYQQKRFNELGVNILITRDNDIFIDLTDRQKLIRNSNAKFSISNHINAGGGTGLEIWRSIKFNSGWGEKIINEIKNIGIPIRGVKTKKSTKYDNRDYYAMNNTHPVEGIIIEYGFIDSNDYKWLQSRWQELAEAIVKATCEQFNIKYILPIGDDILNQFKDKNEIPQWAEKEIRFFVEKGILNGNELGYLLPNKSLTKAEASKFIYNVLKEFNIIKED